MTRRIEEMGLSDGPKAPKIECERNVLCVRASSVLTAGIKGRVCV